MLSLSRRRFGQNWDVRIPVFRRSMACSQWMNSAPDCEVTIMTPHHQGHPKGGCIRCTDISHRYVSTRQWPRTSSRHVSCRISMKESRSIFTISRLCKSFILFLSSVTTITGKNGKKKKAKRGKGNFWWPEQGLPKLVLRSVSVAPLAIPKSDVLSVASGRLGPAG